MKKQERNNGEQGDSTVSRHRSSSSIAELRRIAKQLSSTRYDDDNRSPPSCPSASPSEDRGLSNFSSQQHLSGMEVYDGSVENEDSFQALSYESPIRMHENITPLPSNSASESYSSDLSLPRSFGEYATTCRNTNRNTGNLGTASRFDDQLGSTEHLSSRQDLLRKFYEAQVQKIRSQLVATTRALEQAEVKLKADTEQWKDQTEVYKNEMKAIKMAANEREQQLKKKLKELEDRLTMEKRHLSQVEISDKLATQLAAQDERELSVKEHVQLFVHQKLSEMSARVQASESKLSDASARAKEHQADAETYKSQLNELSHATQLKEQDLQRQLEISEATRVEAEKQIESLSEQLTQYREDQQRRTSSGETVAQIQAQNEDYKAQVKKLGNIEADYKESQHRCEDLERQVALLTNDKEYLLASKSDMEAQEAKLWTKQQDLYNQLEAMHLKREEQAKLSQDERKEVKMDFERKCEDEMTKWMEIAKKELDHVRENGRIVFERENQLLKQARDDAINHADLLDSKLQRIQSVLDAKTLEMAKMESDHATSIAGVRNDLKIKHFELSQLKITLEEKSKDLQYAKSELDVHQQKIQVTQEEFSRLESTSTSRIVQLEAELEAAKQQLREYEKLEVDLDDAIIHTGEATYQNNGEKDVLNEAMDTLRAVPARPQRRFQQSVALAQRLVKSQRNIMMKQQEVDQLKVEKAEMQNRCQDLQDRMRHLAQPQSYLIEKLQKMEKGVADVQKQMQQKEKLVETLRAECRRESEVKRQLQAQLQQLLTRRHDLDGLKSNIKYLQQQIEARVHNRAHERVVDTTTNTMFGSSKLASPPPADIAAKMTQYPTPNKSQFEYHSPMKAPAAMETSGHAPTTAQAPRWFQRLSLA